MKGLYIHIPFCVQKCKYCDFTSFAGIADKADAYLDALFREWEQYRGEKVDTVFIGGGTPTALSTQQLDTLLKQCAKTFSVSSDAEFSMEMNPKTADDDKIKALLFGGVNRISVGIQSLNDSELKKIGRIHSAESAYTTVCRLNELGFKNINADIMTALPDQTCESLDNTLTKLSQLPLTHISAYSLIIEDGTPLASEYDKGLIKLPDEDTDRKMYHMTVEKLNKLGFNQYEISNFAKSGYECRHNIKYWECEEYIGTGLSAHSYDGNRRYFNTDNFIEYLDGISQKGADVLSQSDKISEFIIMGMRMNKGISRLEFKKRFGFEIEEKYQKQLEKFMSYGLIISENNSYKFSDKGRDVSNSVLCEFV